MYGEPVLPVSNFLAFAVTAAIIVAIPGPSVLFTISRALTVGRRSAFLTVMGNAVGGYLQVVAAAFGIGAIVAHSATAFTVIKYLGAAYIVYLGIQAIRHRRSISSTLDSGIPVVSSRRALRDGLITGVTNPKSIVVIVTVMPTFTDPAAGPVWLQLLLLGALFPVFGLLLDGTWAAAAGTARAWLARSPRRMAAIGGTGGLVMIGLGTSLAFTGRQH